METILQTTSKLKYNIKLKLAALTEPQRLAVKKKIKRAHGISDSTYSRYINARKDESTDIPGAILATFAHWLHTSIDDLYNND